MNSYSNTIKYFQQLHIFQILLENSYPMFSHQDKYKNKYHALFEEEELVHEIPIEIGSSTENSWNPNRVLVISSSENEDSYLSENSNPSNSETLNSQSNTQLLSSGESYMIFNSESDDFTGLYGGYALENESFTEQSSEDFSQSFTDSISELESSDDRYSLSIADDRWNLENSFDSNFLDLYQDISSTNESESYLDYGVYPLEDRAYSGISPHSNYLPSNDNITSPPVHSLNQTRMGNQEDQDVVVIESIDRSRMYPRVDSFLIISVIRKLLFVHYSAIQDLNHISSSYYSFFQVQLRNKLEELSPEEQAYLKDKVRATLHSLISDTSRVNSLVNQITPEKIDNLQSIDLCNPSVFKTTKFKDLINVECKNCSICFEDFKAAHACVTLKCCHTFHSKCIKKWAGISWCCPICRRRDIHGD